MRKIFLKNRAILYAILSVFILLVIVKVFVLDNPDVLCIIAEGFDDPSASYYFVIEKIYKLSTSKEIGEKFLRYLKDNKNGNLHGLYIRILGVIGDNKAIPILKKYYIKHQHSRTKKLELYYTVKSMGLIGDKETIFFLKNLLQTTVESNAQVDASTISVALYLITGDDNYQFVNSVGKTQRLHLTKGLIEARKAIISSKGRKRTTQEMIALDNIFRPPGSKWGHAI